MRSKIIAYLKYFCVSFLCLWINTVTCQNKITNNQELYIEKVSRKADSLFLASNYSGAIKNYLNLADYYSDKSQWEGAINAYLQIASSYQVKGMFDSSFYFIKTSNDLIKKNHIKSEILLGKYYYIKGTTHNKFGENDSALISLNLSMKYLSEGINDSMLVLVKRSLGNIHLLSGKLEMALEQYNNALNIEKNRKPPSEIMLAAIFQNIGIVYSTSSNYDSAYPYLTKSIELKEKTLDKNDPQLAIGFINYGRFLFLIGFPNQALQYYTKAEEIYYTKFGKNYFGLAPIYFNKGSLFIQLRDYNKALNYHEQALEIYKLNNNPIVTDLLMNLGVIYNELGDYTKAIGYFKQSIKESENSASNVNAYKNLAKCFYNLGDHPQAEIYYKLSIKESEELFGSTHYLTAGSYNAYGVFCMNIKNYKKAEEFLLKAYHIWKDNIAVKNQVVSWILSDLGDLYYNLEEIDKALIYYQKAIISNTKSFNIENIYKNPDFEDLEPELNTFIFLYKKTQALYDNYLRKTRNYKDLDASYNTSILAIKLFESISSSYKDDNTKILINEFVYDIFNKIVLIAAELYEIEKDQEYLSTAFEYSEKGKAAVLLSSIRELEALEIGNIPSEIRIEEQTISSEITILKNLINDENQKVTPDSIKLSTWKRNLFENTISYDSIIRLIENNYPDYYNFKYNFNVIKTSEVQNNLLPNQVF
ncbi:MAG TPA: tetratricopeptide repeat protein, partial [Ignavibacteriaceae bacterium]|nr:tetratricopeptide repeat protein [Ignavibacteriaceae bacterium]